MILFACFVFFAVPALHAQTAFPSRTIALVVPFTPGTGADVIARLMSPRLAERLQVAVVVENKAGASGAIGTELVAKAPPDGHTLMLGSTGTQTMAPHLALRLGYDPLNAFAPVSLVGTTPTALVVRPTLPVQSVRELIEYAKTRPSLLTYASSGNGTTLHLAGVLFQQMAEVELVHVSYKGNAPALNDLLGGQVDMMFSALPPLLPLAKAGKLRILGVGSLDRHRSAPELPTIAEQGLPDYESSTWYGVFTVTGTPQESVERISREIRKSLDDAKTREAILAQGVDPKGSTPAEFRQFFAAEYARWGKLIKQAGIKAD